MNPGGAHALPARAADEEEVGGMETVEGLWGFPKALQSFTLQNSIID